MKKIIIALVVVVAAYFIALFSIKGKADAELERQVELMNQQVGFTATVEESKKGLFGGSDKIQLAMVAAGSTQNIAMLTNDYRYGPVMLTDDGIQFGLLSSLTTILFDEEVTGDLPSSVDLNNSLVGKSVIGFTGNFTADLDFKGLSLNEDGAQMEFAPAKLNLSGKFDLSEITGQGSWQGMTMTSPSGEIISLDDLTLDLTQSLLAGDVYAGTAIYEGDFNYKIASFNIKEGADDITLNNLQMSGIAEASNQEKTAMEVILKMSADDFLSPEQKFSDFQFNMAMKNLDVATMQEFMTLYQSIAEATAQGLDASMYQMQIMNLGMQLVQKGPKLEITDSQVVTMHGPIKLDMDINVAGDKVDPANMMSMMMAVDAKLNAEGPRMFFELMDMGPMIEQNIQQNMIIDDNGTLKVEATFKEGNMLINGQQMPGLMM